MWKHVDRKRMMARFAVVLISAVLCFYNLGKESLSSWDESLYGSNAYEMDQRSEWLNPYYKGRPDDWNVKPPLMVNLIRLSYRLWGENEFGLRFPSAVSAMVLLLVFYLFVERQRGISVALLTIAMLWGCTGLIGDHAGRSGDTDALFSLLVLLTVLSTHAYVEGRRSGLIIASVFAGMAFLTKSTAIFLVAPGILGYLVISKRFVLKDLMLPTAIFLFFPITWILMNMQFGASFEDNSYGGSNSWSNALIYDTFQRFTGGGQFAEIPKKHDFILTFLDSRFNLWHIPFLLMVIWMIVHAARKRRQLVESVRHADPLLKLSVSIALPYLILLQVSANVNGWYLVPLLPFIAIVTAHGFQRLELNYPSVRFLWIGLAVFTTVRHLHEHYRIRSADLSFYEELTERLEDSDCLLIDRTLEPRETLYAQWYSETQCFVGPDSLSLAQYPAESLLLTRKADRSEHRIIQQNDQLMLVEL